MASQIEFPELRCYCGHIRHQHALGQEKCDNCNCSRFRMDLSVTDDTTEAADPSQDMCVVPNSVATNRGATEIITVNNNNTVEYSGKVFAITEEKKSLRTEVLEEANSLVTGDRNNTYGEPHQDFARTAGALTALGYRGPNGRDIQAHDVAIMVGVVKMSRLMWTPTKRDSWVDLAGYAACGFEAAELTLNTKE